MVGRLVRRVQYGRSKGVVVGRRLEGMPGDGEKGRWDWGKGGFDVFGWMKKGAF